MKRRFIIFTALVAVLAVLVLGCATLFGQAGDNAIKSEAPSEASNDCPPCEVSIPRTNAEIRLWYNQQVVIISRLNIRWVEEGLSARERAKRAYTIRHDARINARLLMPNKDEVEMLRARDRKKYGNPDGPTFSYLVEKNREKGLTGDDILEEIIKSSGRTSPEYNKRFGVKGDGK